MKRLLSAGAVMLGGVVSVLMLVGPSAANAATTPLTAHHLQSARPSHGIRPDTVYQIQNCDGRLENFTVGSDSAVWHQWQTSPGGPWSGWSSLGGYLISDIAVIRNVTCKLEVFGVGGDHAMWHIWQNNAGTGPWSGWSSLGGYLTSSPSAGFFSNGEAVIQALGGDYNPWCDHQGSPGSGPWSGWYRC